jgi:hypothetical protein
MDNIFGAAVLIANKIKGSDLIPADFVFDGANYYDLAMIGFQGVTAHQIAASKTVSVANIAL